MKPETPETHETYWVFKGCNRDFFVCATPDEEHMALCVFDSEATAEKHLRGLSEPQMFLDTLEWYGASVPSWVRRESLLPRLCEVSRRELWEVIEALRFGYVAINPPPRVAEGRDSRTETLPDVPCGVRIS